LVPRPWSGDGEDSEGQDGDGSEKRDKEFGADEFGYFPSRDSSLLGSEVSLTSSEVTVPDEMETTDNPTPVFGSGKGKAFNEEGRERPRSRSPKLRQIKEQKQRELLGIKRRNAAKRIVNQFNSYEPDE